MVDGAEFLREFSVVLDPRVESPPSAIAQQYAAAMRCYNAYGEVTQARQRVSSLRASLGSLMDTVPGGLRDALKSLEEQARSLEGEGLPENPDIAYSSAYAADPASETMAGLQQKFLFIMAVVNGADAMPTSQALQAIDTLEQTMSAVLGRWTNLQSAKLHELNGRLLDAGLTPIELN